MQEEIEVETTDGDDQSSKETHGEIDYSTGTVLFKLKENARGSFPFLLEVELYGLKWWQGDYLTEDG